MGKTAIFIFVTFALGLWLEYIWKFDLIILIGFSLLIIIIIIFLLIKNKKKSFGEIEKSEINMGNMGKMGKMVVSGREEKNDKMGENDWE